MYGHTVTNIFRKLKTPLTDAVSPNNMKLSRTEADSNPKMWLSSYFKRLHLLSDDLYTPLKHCDN